MSPVGRVKSSLLLALVAGLTAGACAKPGGDDGYKKDCSSVGGNLFWCEGFATPEGSDYTADCVARGKKVARADETCGDLWAEAYSCVAALPCEEFNEWRYNHHEENAFDTECGDLPLWVGK